MAGVVGVTAACPRRGPGEPVERASSRRTDLILREEFENRHWANAYDLVATLRPSWLNDRGPDSLGEPAQLLVHFNGARAGGVGVLQTMIVAEVVYLEYVDPVAATARWGIGYGRGAINVSTQSR